MSSYKWVQHKPSLTTLQGFYTNDIWASQKRCESFQDLQNTTITSWLSGIEQMPISKVWSSVLKQAWLWKHAHQRLQVHTAIFFKCKWIVHAWWVGFLAMRDPPHTTYMFVKASKVTYHSNLTIYFLCYFSFPRVFTSRDSSMWQICRPQI